LGTVNPVQEIAAAAHEVGAWVYVDAVQAAPHIPISVRQLQADFLVFSVYKVFGPHVSVLYGREPILKDLPPFKVRPASNKPPGKFETGTQNHEGIAGFLGVMEYLEGLAEEQEADADRRSRLKSAMTAIQGYESGLITALQSTLAEVDGLHMYGPMDADPPFDRVPTFSFHPARGQPRAVATELAQRDVYVWNGNFYAQAVTERLGLENRGGLVRIGLVHYNTHDEIGRLADALPDSLQAAATSN
jgi:selenocysteine lyase/cysteine desulfurase